MYYNYATVDNIQIPPGYPDAIPGGYKVKIVVTHNPDNDLCVKGVKGVKAARKKRDTGLRSTRTTTSRCFQFTTSFKGQFIKLVLIKIKQSLSANAET